VCRRIGSTDPPPNGSSPSVKQRCSPSPGFADLGLVSIGGLQSNHTGQVAPVAAHLALSARLVQEKWVPWDDPVDDKVGNILLSRMMGPSRRRPLGVHFDTIVVCTTRYRSSRVGR
jgi:hypothetical protein